MIYKFIASNFLLAAFLFLLSYKKFKLPKTCFLKETFIIGCISSITGLMLKAYTGSFTAAYPKFLVIFFLSFTAVILWSFFRDPKREFNGPDDLILSPADGRILYIRKVEKGNIPVSIKGKSNIPLMEITKTDILNQDCIIIGIIMSILDVHVNRSPVPGEVILQKHIEGKFLSLKSADSDTQNERNIIVIRNKKFSVGIVQIASRVVRRILTFLDEGQSVNRGDKIGRIMFGSQVDVILPATCELLVKEGMYVYAGKSVIARAISNT